MERKKGDRELERKREKKRERVQRQYLKSGSTNGTAVVTFHYTI